VSGLSSVAERSFRARLGAAYSIASIGLMRLDPTRRVRVSAIDQVYRRTPEAVRARLERLLGALARGEIVPRVGATLRLAEAAEAHRLMESGTVTGRSCSSRDLLRPALRHRYARQ
jgi:NADPH:quinone reductase-like Zn-dependent oxidoreductase